MTGQLAVFGLAGALAWVWGAPVAAVSGEAARRPRPSARVLGGAAVSVVFGLGALAGVRTLLLAAVVAGLAATVVAAVARSRAARRRRARQAAVVEFCDTLRAELLGGTAAPDALRSACEVWPEWEPMGRAAVLGADVAAVVRASAAAPGAGGLRAIAAAWQVAGRSGAGLASVLAGIADGLRDDHDARAELTAGLAPARSTARMLAVLPVFGVLMGISIGADPLGFLLTTPAGLGCLLVGGTLAVAGLWWVERIAAAVEE